MGINAILEECGARHGYVYGEAWERNASAVGEGNALFFCSPEGWLSSSVLSERAVQLAEFKESSRSIKFAEGMDIVGRCAETNHVVWETDVSVLPAKLFSRTSNARRAGLRQALAIPLAPPGGAVSRVIVLFAARPAELDRVQVETILSKLAQMPPLPARERAPTELPIFTASVMTPTVKTLFGTKPGQRTAQMAGDAWLDLEQVPFFRKFADVFHIIWRSAVVTHLAPSSTVFARGDPGGACFVVLSGALRIAKDDVYKFGSLLLPGDAAGESAMLHSRAHGPRCATVTAAETTELLVVELHTGPPRGAPLPRASQPGAGATEHRVPDTSNGGSSSASSAGGSDCGTATTSTSASPEVPPSWPPSAACLHASGPGPLPPPPHSQFPQPAASLIHPMLQTGLFGWPLLGGGALDAAAAAAAGRPRSAPPGPGGVPALPGGAQLPAVSAWQQTQAFQAELERHQFHRVHSAQLALAAAAAASAAPREAVEAVLHLPLKEASERLGFPRRRMLARPASVPHAPGGLEAAPLRAMQGMQGHLHSQSAPDLAAAAAAWAPALAPRRALARPRQRAPHAVPLGRRLELLGPAQLARGVGPGEGGAGGALRGAAAGKEGAPWSAPSALDTPTELPSLSSLPEEPPGPDPGAKSAQLPPISLLRSSPPLAPLEPPAPSPFTPSFFLSSATPAGIATPTFAFP
eukprot:tig00000237_g20459.t1